MTAKEKSSAKGAQALFAAAFTYAFTPVLVREMTPMWGDKAQVAIRWFLVAVFLIIYGFFKKTKVKIPRNKRAYAATLGVSFALVVLFFTFSVQKTTIANALFTYYATNMITSFLLGTFLLKESVSRTKIVAIIFALAGLSLYSGALAAGSLGIIFGVVAGVADGFSNLLRKRLRGVNSNAVLRVQYVIGSIFIILLTLLSKDQIVRTVSWHVAILTIIFAFILIAAGNLLLYGFQHFDINIGTVITSTELVFGALFGLILYHEVPAAHELLGGVLIFSGSVLGSIDLERIYLRQRSKNRNS